MKSEKRIIKSVIVLGILIILCITLGMNASVYYENDQDINNKERIQSAGYWVVTTPIIVDPNHYFGGYNWNEMKSTYPWCNGAGTPSDPYVIENVTFSISSGSYSLLILVSYFNYFEIRNCTFTGNTDVGILFLQTRYGLIINNTIYGHIQSGILLCNSDNNNIQNNTVTNNGDYGIALGTYIFFGIYPFTNGNHYNDVIGNTVENHDEVGIGLMKSDYNIIENNTVIDNDLSGIGLTEGSDHNIIENNTVDGQECGIALNASNHNEIIDNTVSNSLLGGIGLNYSDFNDISRNEMNENIGFGIGIQNSNNNTIYNNIANNNGQAGLYATAGMGLINAHNNTVYKNDANYNKEAGIGLLDSKNNTILENCANQNGYVGMVLLNSDWNTLVQNDIMENVEGGMGVDDFSDENIIYNNNFIGNPMTAVDNGTNNKWDNESLGNYWDDYSGFDISPKDGIGDTPYDVPGTAGSQDHYPIWIPFLRLITPENKSYTSPMAGFYPATYGFENDIDGSVARDWSGAGEGKAIVEASYDGHNKVIKHTTYGWDDIRVNFDNQTSGTIEFYFNTNDTNKDVQFNCFGYNSSDQVTRPIILGVNGGRFLWHNGISWYQLDIPTTCSENTWYHVRIDFDCDTDTWNTTINGALKSWDNKFLLVGDSDSKYISELRFYQFISPVTTRFDAIGYSWEDGYQIGDNQKEGLLLDIADNFGLNWSAYSLDSQANITILGDKVIPIPEYGAHTIQIFANDSNGVNYKTDIRYFCVNYTRIPILIDELYSDKEWEDAVLKYDFCTGSGSEIDPYIIEWVVIDAGGSSYGISIRNSEADYFIIRNCMIYNAGTMSVYSDAGIFLFNTQLGKIQNNELFNNNLSTYLLNSHYNTISDNILYQSDYGIALDGSENNTISLNEFLNHNKDAVILTNDSYNNTISDNDMFDNYQSGINIYDCINNSIYGNNVYLNILCGIWIQGGSTGNKVYNNEISENINIGLLIQDAATQNKIYLNQFIDNGWHHAFDNGIDNQWDDGSIGNYWDNYTGTDKDDDGKGDTPWAIPGSANSQDRYTIWDDGPEPPKLTQGCVFPTVGHQSTQFTFTVIYTEQHDYAPSFIRVVINGTAYDMVKDPGDNDFTDGCIYNYTTILTPAQYNYTYYFECSCSITAKINYTISYNDLSVYQYTHDDGDNGDDDGEKEEGIEEVVIPLIIVSVIAGVAVIAVILILIKKGIIGFSKAARETANAS